MSERYIRDDDTRKAHKIRHSLDDRWRGLTNSEKEEVLDIFEKVNKKRLEKLYQVT